MCVPIAAGSRSNFLCINCFFRLLLLVNIDRPILEYVTVLMNLSFSLLFYQFSLHVFGSIAVKVNRWLGLLYLLDELVTFSVWNDLFK